MSNTIKKHPCLDNIWKIVCGEYGLPRDAPFPDLPRIPAKELEIAEYWALIMTMGKLTKWINGESFSCNSTLLKVMQDLWHEADNV